MTELDDLRHLAAETDRELADTRTMLVAQTSLMQALRETQNSMNRVLGEQGTALGSLLLEIIKIQDRLKTIERDHGARLKAIEHGHGAKLDEHSAKLDEILTLLRQDNAG